jgi:hypothetical protein
MKILDRGPGTTIFAEAVGELIRSLPYTHAVIGQRIGFSDRFLYRQMLPILLERGEISVILPFGRALDARFDLNIVRKGCLPESNDLIPGQIYQLSEIDASTVSEFLLDLRGLLASYPQKKLNLVVVLDSLAPMEEELELSIRRLLRDGRDLHLSVWLHYPLKFIPRDLFGQVGNVLVFLPSMSELRILRRALPLPAQHWKVSSLRRCLILYGHAAKPASWNVYGPIGSPRL